VTSYKSEELAHGEESRKIPEQAKVILVRIFPRVKNSRVSTEVSQFCLKPRALI
jgi:hypothetical protein